jgi:asparagine synthase (glutamine-hydrolysing)
MCGIFGFFSKSRLIKKDEISRTMDSLRHRGPDYQAVTVFHDTSHSTYPFESMPPGEWSSVMAHARLSIIDLTPCGHQPMCNEDETLWIVYNGEIYNFMEVRKILQAQGHRFRSRSDTEVIIHGYEEWGRDVVNRLRGMFAFALLDLKKHTLLLVRDRLGVKPLKYFYDRDTLVFSSELTGMMHLIPRQLNTDALNAFFTLKYIPSPRTVIRDVRKLSPGEMVEIDLHTGALKSDFYWRPHLYPKTDLSFAEAKEQFKKLLSESVLMRTISDVPIGVYLSGGIDSSAILAFLRQNNVDDINSFTIKFDRQGYDESGYARRVSELFRTKHHEFQIPELSHEAIRDIVCSLDEPFGDPSYIPTYYLSKFTAPSVKVILSGDGGDETLGSYKRYFIHARGDFMKFLPRIRSRILKKMTPGINKKSISGRLQRMGEQMALGYWDAYFLRFNGMDDSFKRFLMTEDFYQHMHSLTLGEFLDLSGDFQDITDTKERLIWIDMKTYLPDYILTKTDLALMAHSVEGRNPFVDYQLVDFANALPPEYKFRNGGKHILKTILGDYLPGDIICRKKMGFSPPIKYWFKGNRDLLEDVFSARDFISTDIFDLNRIHQAVGTFRKEDVNISEQLWLIMVLEHWRREYRL